VIVHNTKELRKVAQEYGSEAIVYIASTVGGRKRAQMREEAKKLGILLANSKEGEEVVE